MSLFQKLGNKTKEVGCPDECLVSCLKTPHVECTVLNETKVACLFMYFDGLVFFFQSCFACLTCSI